MENIGTKKLQGKKKKKDGKDNQNTRRLSLNEKKGLG